MLNIVEVKAYKVPLIEQDNTTQGGIKTAEQIRNLPTKNINAIAATTAGLSSIDGGDINIRGSRSNATDYYLDGMRVINASLIPQSEIEQLQVITGGIEARYGDVTGGSDLPDFQRPVFCIFGNDGSRIFRIDRPIWV